MLVLFKSALASRLLFVNPALVRTVVDGDQMGPSQDLLRWPIQRYNSMHGDGSSTGVSQRAGADRGAPKQFSVGRKPVL